MPKGVYKRNFENHVKDCNCMPCRMKRGEFQGRNNPAKRIKIQRKIRLSKLGETNSAKRPEVKEKIRKSKLGDKNPMKNPEVAEKSGKNRVGLLKGEKNPNWQGGISFLPYPFIFGKDLKEHIRKRDNYICQLCKKSEEEEFKEFGQHLAVHHIDHNINNCNENNLITLCCRCNSKVNFNIEFWKEIFLQKISNLYND